MRNLNKSSFTFKIKDSKLEYWEISFNEAAKNYQNHEPLGTKPLMYSTKGLHYNFRAGWQCP